METLAGAPEDEGEDSEEQNKEQEEAEIQSYVAAGALSCGISGVVVVVVVNVCFLGLEPLPGGEGFGVSEGGREARGGGLAGVMNRGRMVEMVRRTQGAGPIRHFLHIVVRRALNVVQRAARGSSRPRLVHARPLRVRLHVHFRCP